MNLLVTLLIFLKSANLYDYTLTTFDGLAVPLSDFSGKQVLLVNIASGSRYADQVNGLADLARTHKDDLVVVLIPSNSFTHEPLQDSAIARQMAGIRPDVVLIRKSVVAGASRLAVYDWLSQPVINDFQKFLFDRQGNFLGVFSADTAPGSEVLLQAIADN